MLTSEEYQEVLNDVMESYKELMQEAWGEVPILEPQVDNALVVSMDFDLGDFPHHGQKFVVTPEKIDKLNPARVAKKFVAEINQHRNFCNRCGVPTPHIWVRQHGPYKNMLNQMNYREKRKYTQEEVDMYDLPPDVLEKKLHPILSSRLTKRLKRKEEAERLTQELEKESEKFSTLQALS